MVVEFSLIPMDVGQSLSKYVAQALEVVEKSGLNYRITPMGTIVEGEWDEVMDVIKRAHNGLLESAPRVYTRIVIDDRKGESGRLDKKVASVEEKLNRELRK